MLFDNVTFTLPLYISSANAGIEAGWLIVNMTPFCLVVRKSKVTVKSDIILNLSAGMKTNEIHWMNVGNDYKNEAFRRFTAEAIQIPVWNQRGFFSSLTEHCITVSVEMNASFWLGKALSNAHDCLGVGDVDGSPIEVEFFYAALKALLNLRQYQNSCNHNRTKWNCKEYVCKRINYECK